MKRSTYELKYCERCGALGLRPSHSPETYCGPCGQILINYSFPARAVRGLRPSGRNANRSALVMQPAADRLAAGRVQ